MKFHIRTRYRKGSHWLIFALDRRLLTFELDSDWDLIINYSNRDWLMDKFAKVKVIYFSRLYGRKIESDQRKFSCISSTKLHTNLMEKDILCNSCSEPALTYDTSDTSASTLDGKVCHCQSCSALGRVSLDDERGRMDFILLTLNEIACVDACTLIDAYWASQKRIDELYEEVSKLRTLLKATGH